MRPVMTIDVVRLFGVKFTAWVEIYSTGSQRCNVLSIEITRTILLTLGGSLLVHAFFLSIIRLPKTDVNRTRQPWQPRLGDSRIDRIRERCVLGVA